MNTSVKKEILINILEKIKEYDSICLFRHIRNDGDCVGATKGLKAIIKATWGEKNVYIDDSEKVDYLSFLGPDDDEISDDVYKSSLGIVLDTATTERISNQKYALCRELIKIDHHIPLAPYGDIQWIEEHYVSCCEMIVELYETFSDTLVLTKEAATYLYTGIVTDSGRFKYEEVSGGTLRKAAVLLDKGINTASLYAHLYLDSYDFLKFKSEVYGKMKLTENGVAYIYVDREMQEKFNLNRNQASESVGFLDGIKGCIVWIAFIDNCDDTGSIRVRLRSRFAPINQLGEKYRGGGHAFASGGTVYGVDEINALIADADAYVKDYKENNEGWL